MTVVSSSAVFYKFFSIDRILLNKIHCERGMACQPYVSRRNHSHHYPKNRTAVEETKENISNRVHSLDDLEASQLRPNTRRNEIVRLNVGGSLFQTAKNTLEQKSEFFRALLSGKFGDKDENDGSYFIDRDPEYFKYLLRYLRYGHVQIPTVSAIDIKSEAEYYQIDMDFSGIEDYTTRRQVVVTNGYDEREYGLWINEKHYDNRSNVWKDACLSNRHLNRGTQYHALWYAEYLVRTHGYRIVSHSQGQKNPYGGVYVLEKDIPQMIRIPLKKTNLK